MPNRILKESICVSDSVNSLGWFEEVLFYRLIVNCDDYGRYDARPLIIKNKLFPLKENLTVKNVTEAINKLARVGLIVLYENDGRPFLFLPTWNDHQSIRAKKSKFPDPGNNLHANEINCEKMNANVPVIQSYSESESESYLKAKTRARFAPPSLADVREYCIQRGNSVDPETFIDFYSSKGWKVGSEPMKDWKACVRTWEKRQNNRTANSQSQQRLDEVDSWV